MRDHPPASADRRLRLHAEDVEGQRRARARGPAVGVAHVAAAVAEGPVRAEAFPERAARAVRVAQHVAPLATDQVQRRLIVSRLEMGHHLHGPGEGADVHVPLRRPAAVHVPVGLEPLADGLRFVRCVGDTVPGGQRVSVLRVGRARRVVPVGSNGHVPEPGVDRGLQARRHRCVGGRPPGVALHPGKDRSRGQCAVEQDVGLDVLSPLPVASPVVGPGDVQEAVRPDLARDERHPSLVPRPHAVEPRLVTGVEVVEMRGDERPQVVGVGAEQAYLGTGERQLARRRVLRVVESGQGVARRHQVGGGDVGGRKRDPQVARPDGAVPLGAVHQQGRAHAHARAVVPPRARRSPGSPLRGVTKS